MGTKLVIYGSAILAGALAHYGFADDATFLNWHFFRQDIGWAGNFSLMMGLIMVIWGLWRKD